MWLCINQQWRQIFLFNQSIKLFLYSPVLQQELPHRDDKEKVKNKTLLYIDKDSNKRFQDALETPFIIAWVINLRLNLCPWFCYICLVLHLGFSGTTAGCVWHENKRHLLLNFWIRTKYYIQFTKVFMLHRVVQKESVFAHSVIFCICER